MRGWSKNRLGLWSLGILVGIAILLVFTAKWLRTDQPLTDTAKKFIQPDLIYRANVQQHSYFYLLGIAAKDEVHPQALGRYRYHREWANYIQDQNAAENLQIDSGLNRQLSRAGFSGQEKELLGNLQMRLANSAEQFSALVVEHKKLLYALLGRERIPLQRFSDLLEHQDYISLVIPPQAVGPDYRYIQNLQLLKLAHIQLDSGSKVQDYAQQFHQVLDFSRNRLSLVEKMLLQNWLSQMIDLIRIEQKNESNPVMLNNLDSDQLGLKASLQNELMGHYLLTQYLAHASEISPVQLKWLYLPNTTFNAIAAQYEVYWMLSETPYVELQERLTTSEPSSLSKWRLKNAIGHVLAQVSKPNFEKYIVMNHVLNNKIMTFNAVNSGSIETELLNQNAAGRRYFQQDGKLCIALPFSQQKLSELNLKQDGCVKI